MSFGLPEQVFQALVEQLQKTGNITRAVIFGSRARGNYNQNSDIDIAIYCEGELPASLYLDLKEAAGSYEVDVVDMNTLHNEKLRRRIEEQAVEIYKR